MDNTNEEVASGQTFLSPGPITFDIHGTDSFGFDLAAFAGTGTTTLDLRLFATAGDTFDLYNRAHGNDHLRLHAGNRPRIRLAIFVRCRTTQPPRVHAPACNSGALNLSNLRPGQILSYQTGTLYTSESRHTRSS